MLGKADTLSVLGGYRVLLAPLRFGAGLKGKVADAWAYGMPAVRALFLLLNIWFVFS